MNFIYEVDDKYLRAISLNPREVYQLNDLNFYIPRKYKNLTPFLLIKDSEGNKDILRLSHNKSDKLYNIYSVDVSNTVIFQNGQFSIALLVLSNNIDVSDAHLILLDFSNFQIGKQVSLIEGMTRNLIATYEKIERMTKMNIELYQDIEEALNSD